MKIDSGLTEWIEEMQYGKKSQDGLAKLASVSLDGAQNLIDFRRSVKQSIIVVSP